MLNEASQLQGTAETLQPTRDTLRLHRQYHDFLDAGDAAREKSDFGRAKSQYHKAQDVMDTPEVRQRLEEAEYADAIAKARSYLSIGNYKAARSWVNIAASERNTEEVQKLREEIETAAKSS